jgi:flagellar biosynthesis protein FlhG
MQPDEVDFKSTAKREPRMAATRPVRVIAITSGKGGAGKTTVSINLAMATASLGKEVTLLDADLGLANIDVMLGLKPVLNLSHVIDGVCRLEEIILKGPGSIKIIPASSGVRRMADLSAAEHAGLVYAFSALADLTDTLIVDTAAGIFDNVIRFCAAAQEVIVVVCNEPASITDAYAMIKVLHQDHGLSQFRVLVNMAHSPQEGQMLFHKLVAVTERFLNVSLDLIATVPYDPNLRNWHSNSGHCLMPVHGVQPQWYSRIWQLNPVNGLYLKTLVGSSSFLWSA